MYVNIFKEEGKHLPLMTLIPLIFISSNYVVESDSRFLLRRNDKSNRSGNE